MLPDREEVRLHGNVAECCQSSCSVGSHKGREAVISEMLKRVASTGADGKVKEPSRSCVLSTRWFTPWFHGSGSTLRPHMLFKQEPLLRVSAEVGNARPSGLLYGDLKASLFVFVDDGQKLLDCKQVATPSSWG